MHSRRMYVRDVVSWDTKVGVSDVVTEIKCRAFGFLMLASYCSKNFKVWILPLDFTCKSTSLCFATCYFNYILYTYLYIIIIYILSHKTWATLYICTVMMHQYLIFSHIIISNIIVIGNKNWIIIKLTIVSIILSNIFFFFSCFFIFVLFFILFYI